MSELNPVESSEDPLPEEFRTFLNSRYGSPPAVTASVDEEILRRAKAHLTTKSGGSTRHWKGRFWVYAAAASTIAAAGLLIMTAPLNMLAPASPENSLANAPQDPSSFSSLPADGIEPAGAAMKSESDRLLAEDLDRNGKVNILDAFAVARLIQAGRSVDMRSDVNGDGRVDSDDVKQIAQMAVAL